MQEKETERVLVYSLDRDAAYSVATGIVSALALLVAVLAFLPTTATLERDLGAAGPWLWRGGILVLAVGLLTVWARWLPRHVRRLHWDRERGVALVERYGVLRRTVTPLRPDAITRVTTHDGKLFVPPAPRVDAPYWRIEWNGGRDLILDAQGRVVDEAALAAILAGKAPS
jgi:hypothetical protein